MTFMTTIYDSEIRGIGEDQMCQKADKKKGFKVGVYYQPLDSDTNTATTDHLFPWNIIWRSKAPLRVAFFVQTAALGNILTIDNLMKRKVKIIFWCYMCKCNGESVDHLLLHYPIISDLWSMIFGLFGVFQVMPKSVVEPSLQARSLFLSSSKWSHLDDYTKWSHLDDYPTLFDVGHLEGTNSRSFEDIKHSKPAIKLFLFQTLLDWLTPLRNLFFFSIVDLLYLCNFCN